MRGRIGGPLRAGIGIAISLVCLYLVVRGVDLAETGRLLGQANPVWLVVALAAVGGDLLFRALRWQRLVAPIHPVPLRRLTGYMLVGYLANNVLPARLGEVVRSHYLGDREGISRTATLGTVVVERVIDTVVLVAIGAAAILVLHVRGIVANAVLIGLAVAGLLVVALVVALAAHRLPGASRIAAALERWPRVVGAAIRLRDGLRVAALPRTVAAAVVFSIVAWGCTVVAVVAIGQALGIQLTWGEGALLAAGTNLATAIPSGPGYVGTFEIAGQKIAAAFGIAAPQGLALALLIHVATLLVSSLGGVLAFLELGWTARHRAASPAGVGAAGVAAATAVGAEPAEGEAGPHPRPDSPADPAARPERGPAAADPAAPGGDPGAGSAPSDVGMAPAPSAAGPRDS